MAEDAKRVPWEMLEQRDEIDRAAAALGAYTDGDDTEWRLIARVCLESVHYAELLAVVEATRRLLAATGDPEWAHLNSASMAVADALTALDREADFDTWLERSDYGEPSWLERIDGPHRLTFTDPKEE